MTQAFPDKRPIFRFAPSPNGLLHLGHAYSALLNLEMARSSGGKMLLRIEDIDRVRCTPKLVSMMLEDLDWIGFEWDEEPRQQSQHFAEYEAALKSLDAMGLVYPAFMSRSEIRAHADAHPGWPSDPDGAPLYPGRERSFPGDGNAISRGPAGARALRLDMAAALTRVDRALSWQEGGEGPEGQRGRAVAVPALWGDAVLGRKDVSTSYHLACVVDDNLQGVTHVVRGKDLFHATSLHRLLQELFGMPAPLYHHHRHIVAADGAKLSKSRADTGIRHLREAGVDASKLRCMLGFGR